MARFNIEFSKDNEEEIEQLMALTGIRTKKELINYALTLLSWSVKQCAEGRQIASISENEGMYRELAMPILSNVVKNSEILKKLQAEQVQKDVKTQSNHP
jgi:hypothetical protein